RPSCRRDLCGTSPRRTGRTSFGNRAPAVARTTQAPRCQRKVAPASGGRTCEAVRPRLRGARESPLAHRALRSQSASLARTARPYHRLVIVGLDLIRAPARQASALEETAHRPWPMPEAPWIMAQTLDRLLFAHWR